MRPLDEADAVFVFEGAVARGFAVTRGNIDIGKAHNSNSIGMILILNLEQVI